MCIRDRYRISEILSAEETEAALRRWADMPLLISEIPLAKFHFDGITITCQQNRWQIEGTLSQADRCLEILSKTFAVLGETPVTAYGNNYHWHRQTGLQDMPTALGARLQGAGLGLPKGQLQTLVLKDGPVTISIQPSPKGSGVVHAHVLVHHAIEKEVSGEVRFDLGPLMCEAQKKDRVVADEIINRIIAELAGGE